MLVHDPVGVEPGRRGPGSRRAHPDRVHPSAATMPTLPAHPNPLDLARRVLDTFDARIERHPGMFVLGLSGPQGSGKSTLAGAMVRACTRMGRPAQALSLDDVYLGRRTRLALARNVHPLLRTRGVPGTHDLALLLSTLDALAAATPAQPALLPRFDKGRDTRRPPSRWPRVTQAPRVLVLEGWCLGVRPQSRAALAQPVNALEREADPDGSWRRYVNRKLRAMQPAWARLDALVALTAPDWDTVCRWRAQAERALRQRQAASAMDARALRRFMQHFERLSRHAAHSVPGRADLCIALDARRRVRAFRLRGA